MKRFRYVTLFAVLLSVVLYWFSLDFGEPVTAEQAIETAKEYVYNEYINSFHVISQYENFDDYVIECDSYKNSWCIYIGRKNMRELDVGGVVVLIKKANGKVIDYIELR